MRKQSADSVVASIFAQYWHPAFGNEFGPLSDKICYLFRLDVLRSKMTSEETRSAIDHLFSLAEATPVSQRDPSVRKSDHLRDLMMTLKHVEDARRKLIPSTIPPDSRTVRCLTSLEDTIYQNHSEMLQKCADDPAELRAFESCASFAGEAWFVRLQQTIDAVWTASVAVAETAAAASAVARRVGAAIESRTAAGTGVATTRVPIQVGRARQTASVVVPEQHLHGMRGDEMYTGVLLRLTDAYGLVSCKGAIYIAMKETMRDASLREGDYVRFHSMGETPRAREANCAGEASNMNRLEK